MVKELIYILGGTGNIGTRAVKNLLKNDAISVTLYSRSPEKVHRLFGNPSNLKTVQGDYTNLKSFDESIGGHTRLFLLIQDPGMSNLAKISIDFSKRAYAAGVKQIVFISGAVAGYPWRSSFIGHGVYKAEQAIEAIPNRGAFVTLRPSSFMSNHLWKDIHSIKRSSSIISTSDPDSKESWISPHDIGTVSASILQDSIDKHGDCVYEMHGDIKSPKERAEVLTRVLGKEIRFNQLSGEQYYNILINQVGMSHAMAYDLTHQPWGSSIKVTTGLSILLGRAPETLEKFITKHKSAFLN